MTIYLRPLRRAARLALLPSTAGLFGSAAAVGPRGLLAAGEAISPKFFRFSGDDSGRRSTGGSCIICVRVSSSLGSRMWLPNIIIGVEDAVVNVSTSHARGPWFESRRLHSFFILKSSNFVPLAPGKFPWDGAGDN